MLTITSGMDFSEEFRSNVHKGVRAIPTELVDRALLEVPLNRDNTERRHTRRATLLKLETGITWNGEDIVFPVRIQPHLGRRGAGEAINSNFKNCISFSAGNRGCKIFKGGSLQGWSFQDVDQFHSFMQCIIDNLGWGAASINHKDTRVALAVHDAQLALGELALIPLRPMAQFLNSKVDEGEVVEFAPETFKGVKISLRPFPGQKSLSMSVRPRGNVKLHIGRPRHTEEEAKAMWTRVAVLLEGWLKAITPE